MTIGNFLGKVTKNENAKTFNYQKFNANNNKKADE